MGRLHNIDNTVLVDSLRPLSTVGKLRDEIIHLNVAGPEQDTVEL